MGDQLYEMRQKKVICGLRTWKSFRLVRTEMSTLFSTVLAEMVRKGATHGETGFPFFN